MMFSTGYFSDGTKRLLQRHPALPSATTRELAAAFTLAQAEACRQLAALSYPLERIVLELQSGHLDYFREGSDRDRKRSLGKKASYRFAGFAPSHVEEFSQRRGECAAGILSAADFSAWQAEFLFRFTFEMIEQVARRAYPLPSGRPADAGLEPALAAARRLRDQMLDGNLLLVAKVVVSRARFHCGTLCDELFAAGIDGLMISINRYDPAVGHFSTYAMPWIKMAIDRYVAKTRHVIRIPIGMQEKVRRQRRTGENDAGQAEALALLIPEVQSLEEPLPGFADQELRLQDVVADPHTARPLEAAEHADIARILQDRLSQLEPIKQFIIAMRNDIGDAAQLGAQLFREEAALSLARGRAIAAGALKSGDRPARIRRVEAALPVRLPLVEANESLAVAV